MINADTLTLRTYHGTEPKISTRLPGEQTNQAVGSVLI
jgi:hypothetical protein